jgi:NAD(P)-dependent dehydrogenase (short-subunit alcohol dehydrogenase family)
MAVMLSSFPEGGMAAVIGASGGLGGALAAALEDSSCFRTVLALSRTSEPPIDLEDEDSIREAAGFVMAHGEIRLVVDATGFLHGGGFQPEKSWRSLDPAHMAKSFAVNAIGPGLLMKHFLPLLPRNGKSVFATLSAKVGSITDNHLGGWYSYRASKAALNQLVRTAAIELERSRPDAVCIAVHPGTVDTPLSGPFSKANLAVQSPHEAAHAILACLDGIRPESSGGFFDRTGERFPCKRSLAAKPTRDVPRIPQRLSRGIPRAPSHGPDGEHHGIYSVGLPPGIGHNVHKGRRRRH